MIHLSEFLNRLKRKQQLKFPKDISSFDISKMSWIEPFNFRVKKQEDKYRIN